MKCAMHRLTLTIERVLYSPEEMVRRVIDVIRRLLICWLAGALLLGCSNTHEVNDGVHLQTPTRVSRLFIRPLGTLTPSLPPEGNLYGDAFQSPLPTPNILPSAQIEQIAINDALAKKVVEGNDLTAEQYEPYLLRSTNRLIAEVHVLDAQRMVQHKIYIDLSTGEIVDLMALERDNWAASVAGTDKMDTWTREYIESAGIDEQLYVKVTYKQEAVRALVDSVNERISERYGQDLAMIAEGAPYETGNFFLNLWLEVEHARLRKAFTDALADRTKTSARSERVEEFVWDDYYMTATLWTDAAGVAALVENDEVEFIELLIPSRPAVEAQSEPIR